MKTIDFNTWPRYKHFQMFSHFDYPHFNLCVPIDATRVIHSVKKHHFSLTVAFIYLVSRTANAFPAFRQRIRDNEVVEHEVVHPSATILSKDDLYSFCYIPYEADFPKFHEDGNRRIKAVQEHPILEDEPGMDDLIFVSALPWIAFTSISHPIHMHPVDSIPRFSWGKYSEDANKISIPVSVQVHHGLMDGYHVGLYYQHLQELCDSFETFI